MQCPVLTSNSHSERWIYANFIIESVSLLIIFFALFWQFSIRKEKNSSKDFYTFIRFANINIRDNMFGQMCLDII